MVPTSFLRQAPTPLQSSMDRENPPSPEKSKYVLISSAWYAGPNRRLSVIFWFAMILPGFMMPFGSNTALTALKASYSRGPKTCSFHSLRTSPSPCSELTAPP